MLTAEAKLLFFTFSSNRVRWFSWDVAPRRPSVSRQRSCSSELKAARMPRVQGSGWADSGNTSFPSKNKWFKVWDFPSPALPKIEMTFTCASGRHPNRETNWSDVETWKAKFDFFPLKIITFWGKNLHANILKYYAIAFFTNYKREFINIKLLNSSTYWLLCASIIVMILTSKVNIFCEFKLSCCNKKVKLQTLRCSLPSMRRKLLSPAPNSSLEWLRATSGKFRSTSSSCRDTKSLSKFMLGILLKTERLGGSMEAKIAEDSPADRKILAVLLEEFLSNSWSFLLVLWAKSLLLDVAADSGIIDSACCALNQRCHLKLIIKCIFNHFTSWRVDQENLILFWRIPLCIEIIKTKN